MKLHNMQILLIRLALGGLFLNFGIGKINQGWLQNSTVLTENLQNFQKNATGYHLAYLTKIAVPYQSLWAKLIAIGEAAIGISLLIGLFARLSSGMGIFMVLNLHAATGNLYSLSFFGSPSGFLIIAGFLVTLLAGAGRWFGFDQLLLKLNPKSMLW